MGPVSLSPWWQFSPPSGAITSPDTPLPDPVSAQVSVDQPARGPRKKTALSSLHSRRPHAASHNHLLVPTGVTRLGTLSWDKIFGHRKRLAQGWSLRLAVKGFKTTNNCHQSKCQRA